MTKRKSWALKIAEAEKRGKFTRLEHRQAARSWFTCAVGEKHGFAEDLAVPDWRSEECQLGIKFGQAVEEDNIPEAKRLYEEIMALP